MTARREVEVEVAGHRLALSRLDKVFYPATGFTKGDVIDYYARVAPALLPHLRDRPLTLKRYPDGAQGSFFYEKRCPSHRPSWIETAAVWSEGNQATIHFCVVNDPAALVWAVNLADLEMHAYLHRAPAIDTPTALVFDLDPGPPADLVQCCEVALLLKALFDRLELAAFPKTSGSKGLQVYVPLNTPVTYGETKAFARAVAELLERQRPDLVVSSMKKALRTGKVLVDWSQNDPHKTTVCVWSLRAKERPTVSTPVRWKEVEGAHRAGDAGRLAFEAKAALERLRRQGDLFAPVLTLQQHLPGLQALGGLPSLGTPGRHLETSPTGTILTARRGSTRRTHGHKRGQNARARERGQGGRRSGAHSSAQRP
jgi:bifunctional non-homologous end joining protein LigD